MENRRNFAPPIYNVRRVLEAPLPNLNPDVVVELDINAENVIQDAIENIGPVAELNIERGIAQANINEIVGGVENALQNINGIEIEYIKLETPALELHEDDIADFDILLLDELDPLENTADHSDETTNAIEFNGVESFGEEQPIQSASTDNSADSNNIGVASGSGLQRRIAPAPVCTESKSNKSECDAIQSNGAEWIDEEQHIEPASGSGLHRRVTPAPVSDESESDESDHNDQPNVANLSRDETSDNECDFVLINGFFPLPISTTDHNLVKRDDDKLSGKIAFRNEVINCYCSTTISSRTSFNYHSTCKKNVDIFLI